MKAKFVSEGIANDKANSAIENWKRFNNMDQDEKDDLLNNAIEEEDLEEIVLLLDNGGDIDNDLGYPLYLAVSTGNIEIIKLLLSKNASITFGAGDDAIEIGTGGDQDEYLKIENLIKNSGNPKINRDEWYYDMPKHRRK